MSWAAVWWPRCEAFCADRGRAGTPTVDKRYTGQTADQSIGLYFYQSRYYDPALGRFVSPDTIVPDYKNPQALNRYAYGLNNPVRYSDSGGHRAVDQVTPTPQLSTTPAPTPAPALTVTPTSTPGPAAPTVTATPTPALPGPQPVVPGAGGVAMPVSPSPAAAIDWQAVRSQLGQSMGASASFYLGKTWNRPNTMLGQILGTASIALGGTVRYEEGTNIAVFENVQGPAQWLVQDWLGGGGTKDPNAVTLGHVILNAGRFDMATARDRRWFAHEREHVKQGDMMGPLYLVLYGLGYLLPPGISHDEHFMEWWADESARNTYRE